MAELEREIAAFDAMRADLESRAMGKWVVFHNDELSGIYDDFEAAAGEAVRRYQEGPYLIRQVGAPPDGITGSVPLKLP